MADIQIPHNFTPRSYQLELFRAMDGIEGKPPFRDSIFEERSQRGNTPYDSAFVGLVFVELCDEFSDDLPVYKL